MESEGNKNWYEVIQSFFVSVDNKRVRSRTSTDTQRHTTDTLNERDEYDPEATMQLRIMTFNVWYGGDQVNIEDTARAIVECGADIVGIQEPDANLYAIAELAGMPYVDDRRYIISRFPLFNSGRGMRTAHGSGEYSISGLDPDCIHAWVLVKPDRMIAFSNTHLPSDPYGPDFVVAGKTADEIVKLEEEIRGDDVNALVSGLEPLVRENIPLFVTGDFNTPSHLDYTPETVGSQPQIQFPIEWPITKKMEDAGLQDSYRLVNPSPTALPGITHTPGQPAPVPVTNELMDRIDFIWTTPCIEVVSCEVVDDLPSISSDNARIDDHLKSDTPYTWPSDHSAVVATVRLTPIEAVPMIAVTRRRVMIGEDINVYLSVPVGDSWSVVLVLAHRPASEAITGLYNEKLSYRRKIRFGSYTLSPGEYEAVLLSSKSEGEGEELARVVFAVVAPHVVPRLWVHTPVVPLNGEVILCWEHTPGNRMDWVAIYEASNVDLGGFIGNFYTGAKFSGKFRVSLKDSKVFSKQLPTVGEYKAILLRNDEFVALAETRFTVVSSMKEIVVDKESSSAINSVSNISMFPKNSINSHHG